MHVLYVEDDPLNRRVVRDMLSVAGVTMSEAHDAETGLRMIEACTFSLVLMDLRMPGMNGLEAIARIRDRHDEKSLIPIIVVTADAALDMRHDCVAGGADEVLTKPVAMKALFDAIGRTTIRRAQDQGSIAA